MSPILISFIHVNILYQCWSNSLHPLREMVASSFWSPNTSSLPPIAAAAGGLSFLNTTQTRSCILCTVRDMSSTTTPVGVPALYKPDEVLLRKAMALANGLRRSSSPTNLHKLRWLSHCKRSNQHSLGHIYSHRADILYYLLYMYVMCFLASLFLSQR